MIFPFSFAYTWCGGESVEGEIQKDNCLHNDIAYAGGDSGGVVPNITSG